MMMNHTDMVSQPLFRASSDRLKIAISGAVSTGKTTLGKALAGELGVTFIDENLEPMFRITIAERNDPLEIAQRIMKCLERKRALESKEESFVVDRCPLDILNFWYAFRLHSRVDTQAIYERCVDYMKLYDFVVLLPYGVLSYEREPKDDGLERSDKPWDQLHGSARIFGFAHHFLAPDKIIQIPKVVNEVEARLKFVMKVLIK